MRERGFTLVEVVITTALLSSAILVFAMIFISISRLQVKTGTARSTQQSGRYILEQMGRDIRSSSAISTPSGTCLLITPDTQFGGGQISYSYDSAQSTIWRNVIGGCINSSPAVRISESSTRIITTGLTAFELYTSSASKPSVKINFTIKQQDASLDALTGANSYAYTFYIDSVITPREQ